MLSVPKAIGIVSAFQKAIEGSLIRRYGSTRYSFVFVFIGTHGCFATCISHKSVQKGQVSARLLLPHKAFALQNILQALITQALSDAKYLSPKLRADDKTPKVSVKD